MAHKYVTWRMSFYVSQRSIAGWPHRTEKIVQQLTSEVLHVALKPTPSRTRPTPGVPVPVPVCGVATAGLIAVPAAAVAAPLHTSGAAATARAHAPVRPTTFCGLGRCCIGNRC